MTHRSARRAFFPGYFKSSQDRRFEAEAGSAAIGREFGSDWYFNPSGFDQLRRHVEDHSDGRWRYSGDCDLVLVNAWIPNRGEPTIDWESTQSWRISDSLTLPEAIEAISTDLETDDGAPSYGIARIAGQDSANGPSASTARDLVVQALAGIAAALGMKAFGG